ncbi:uncharacterized protein LOC125422774 [Ziziphus jujuba]|uniref:Uncharacterized protein LOC125422774 n=1 Tax=Ziziphus jujuba TaxID=326968 RepID=A0ABM3IL26_ZIZJJ|nr:uncharacterized protein LOC125422774 [Ziziphus jujuba]
MNMCAYEQNAMAGCEGLRMVGSVVCPKPRRLGLLNPSINEQIRPFRYPIIQNQSEIGDTQEGTELLDIILTKGNSTEKPSNQVASSPPYFCGSPPSRASNPVIQDERFGICKVGGPLSPAPAPAPPSPTSRKGGCARLKFGHKPATVRIEGFDCLSRDSRNCSISAVA